MRQLQLQTPEFIDLVRSTLEAGRSLQFRSAGSSMHPFIKDGDAVTIAPLPLRAPRLGDVVLFFHEKARRLFIHRIAKKDGGFLVTKGDGALSDDGRIPMSDVLGKVIRVERDGKKVRLGLGPEGSMLGLLARAGLLSPIVFRLWCYMRPFLVS